MNFETRPVIVLAKKKKAQFVCVSCATPEELNYKMAELENDSFCITGISESHNEFFRNYDIFAFKSLRKKRKKKKTKNKTLGGVENGKQ